MSKNPVFEIILEYFKAVTNYAVSFDQQVVLWINCTIKSKICVKPP